MHPASGYPEPGGTGRRLVMPGLPPYLPPGQPPCLPPRFMSRRGVTGFLIHKTKMLFLPYMVWNIIGNGIAYILKCLGIVDWYCSINLSSLKYCLINGPLSSINGASWFVIMLFYVSIVYNIFSNIFLSYFY